MLKKIKASNKVAVVNLSTNYNFNSIKKLICDNDCYDNIIFLGGINKCNHDYNDWASILSDKIQYVIDAKDLCRLSNLVKSYTFNNEYNFLSKLPVAISIYYPTQISFLAISGGIPLQIKSKTDLNYQICFTDFINKKSWHQYYDGRFGKIISNSKHLDADEPQIHPHSINLFNINNSTYIQEINQFGLCDTIKGLNYG